MLLFLLPRCCEKTLARIREQNGRRSALVLVLALVRDPGRRGGLDRLQGGSSGSVMASAWRKAKIALGLNLCIHVPRTLDDASPSDDTTGRFSDAATSSPASTGSATRRSRPMTPATSASGLRLSKSGSRSSKVRPSLLVLLRSPFARFLHLRSVHLLRLHFAWMGSSPRSIRAEAHPPSPPPPVSLPSRRFFISSEKNLKTS